MPPFGVEIGLWAAAFWALISGDMYLQANQPNTEVFQNLCLVWAFALLLRMPGGRVALGRAATIAALFALASLYKHVALVTAARGCCTDLGCRYGHASQRAILRLAHQP